MKRHIIYIAAAALLTVACTAEKPKTSEGLSFDVTIENDLTPAVKSSIPLMSENGESCYTLEMEPLTKATLINDLATFNTEYSSFEVEVQETGATDPSLHSSASLNSTSGFWDLVSPTYARVPGREISIVAVASNFDNADIFTNMIYGSPATTSFDYTLSTAEADQKDLLFGYYKGDDMQATVPMKFNHALSSIVFSIGALPAGSTLTVNSITLEGIYSSATCSVSFNQTASYTWTNHSGSIDYVKEVDTPAPMSTGDLVFGANSGLIVIPTKFDDSSTARVIVNITEEGRNYDLEASLAGHEWKAGQTHLYSITYHGIKKAILTDGVSFNNAMDEVSGDKTAIEKVVFEVNSSVTTGKEVQAPSSTKIYMNWDDATKTITVSSADFEVFTGKSCREMFENLNSMTSIEGFENINTINCESMYLMFNYCTSMTSFPVSTFNTENVKNMDHIFRGCKNLTSFDFSSWSSKSLEGLERAFCDCTKLTSVTFGGDFKCEKVKRWGFTFANTALTELDCNYLNPKGAMDLEYMVASCRQLKTIDISSFAASNSSIYFVAGLLGGCWRLTSINFGLLSFENVDTTGAGPRNNMVQETAKNISAGGCTFTCTQTAYDLMHMSSTGVVDTRFTWVIVTP